MPAGDGAKDQAERAASAAERLEKKAEGARVAADRWAKGAEGERKVAEALAPLSADGWFFLHDRVMPTGGNVDHLAIGPGGVVVLDAKAWSGEVSVRSGKLRAGRWGQDKAIDGALAQAAAVSAVVGDSVEVVACLVLTEQSTAALERVDGIGIVGIDEVVDVLRQLPGSCSTVEVERMLRVLTEAFAPSGAAPAAALGMVEVDTVDDPRSMYLKAHRFIYLNTWKSRRIYAKDDSGAELGWKDVLTGEVHLEGNHPFAQVVLAAATPAGVQLNAAKLPKVPVDVRGGRLLGAVTRIYMSAVIGMRWEKGGKRRLYGTRANPKDGVIKLGWVDLDSGFIRAETEGPLSPGGDSAAQFLGILRDRLPAR